MLTELMLWAGRGPAFLKHKGEGKREGSPPEELPLSKMFLNGHPLSHDMSIWHEDK